ncbi:phosphodiesterase [Methylobacterium terricola]|uniref:Phosphodiesterase n=1 Tax=Methylobacterium terricola TaxID=2583531 RepID=A0A5C4LRS3_9HYPH|nr:phosphodiesterase [Methylobacterium terricola]TNC15747.1 phosphodiesterase [Methylobacterium terricola]
MLIAHLSDPHLRDRGHLYQGLVDSNAMFEAALRHVDDLDPQPDIVLISGDVVDYGTAAEYAHAAAMLGKVRRPLLIIPGNHDERDTFRACLPHHAPRTASGPLHFAVGDLGAVRILGLDVTVPGAHHGDMDEAACDWLEARLAEEPERPTIVMMHQPPIRSGIPYIDAYRCLHGDRLEQIVLRYPAIERVLCGHVHRFMQRRFGGTVLMTAPSTTTAIALRLGADAEPASFMEPPAMLLHHWHPGSGLLTHLVPIGSFPGPLPFF